MKDYHRKTKLCFSILFILSVFFLLEKGNSSNAAIFECFGYNSTDPLVCSGHGRCVATDNCTCSAPYYPPTCVSRGWWYDLDYILWISVGASVAMLIITIFALLIVGGVVVLISQTSRIIAHQIRRKKKNYNQIVTEDGQEIDGVEEDIDNIDYQDEFFQNYPDQDEDDDYGKL